MDGITVIICTYNSSGTIYDTLKAVFDSSYKNFEVIVIDDCSADGTLNICKNFPVKVIELQENKGPSFARNIGIRNSKCDIVSFFPQLNANIFSTLIIDQNVVGVKNLF